MSAKMMIRSDKLWPLRDEPCPLSYPTPILSQPTSLPSPPEPHPVVS